MFTLETEEEMVGQIDCDMQRCGARHRGLRQCRDSGQLQFARNAIMNAENMLIIESKDLADKYSAYINVRLQSVPIAGSRDFRWSVLNHCEKAPGA